MYVYIIDANSDCREVLSVGFELDGDRVCAFSTFDEACLALEIDDKPELAISEVRVPGKRSLADFGRRLKQLNPDSQLVVYSATEYAKDAADFHADAFVLRPKKLKPEIVAARLRVGILVRSRRLAEEARRLQENTTRLILRCRASQQSLQSVIDEVRETRGRCRQGTDN